MLEQVRALQRRGEQDPRVALAVVDLDRDDEFLARDRLGTRERRAATVRELVAAVVARPALRDSIGIREREQHAGLDGQVAARGRGRAEIIEERALEPAHALERSARDACAPAVALRGLVARGLAAQNLQAAPDVAVALAARPAAAAAQQVALGKQRRELGARARRAEIARREQHLREPRVRPEPVQRAAVRRHAAGRVERAEAAQQVARGGERRGRRRVEPVERIDVGAPDRELERERYQVGRHDLGRRARRERALRALAPEPIAHAGRGPARAARALLGRRARDPLRLEAAHPARGIEHAAPLEP